MATTIFTEESEVPQYTSYRVGFDDTTGVLNVELVRNGVTMRADRVEFSKQATQALYEEMQAFFYDEKTRRR
jgi:hypothetical protein